MKSLFSPNAGGGEVGWRIPVLFLFLFLDAEDRIVSSVKMDSRPNSLPLYSFSRFLLQGSLLLCNSRLYGCSSNPDSSGLRVELGREQGKVCGILSTSSHASSYNEEAREREEAVGPRIPFSRVLGIPWSRVVVTSFVGGLSFPASIGNESFCAR